MDDNNKVPYIVYESEASRHERTVKRLLMALLLTIVLMVGTNLAWLYVWNQYDFSADAYGIRLFVCRGEFWFTKMYVVSELPDSNERSETNGKSTNT